MRVLEPQSHVEDVSETTMIERTLDQAKLGFGFVSESPALIDTLRAPGLVIASAYTNPTPEMVSAFSRYAGRGGNILWTPVPVETLANSPMLQQLTGVASATSLGERRVFLRAEPGEPLTSVLSAEPFRDDFVYSTEPGTARVIFRFGSGEPAVLVNQVGKGRVVTLGFNLMRSTSPVVATLARQMVDWFRTDAGMGAADPLAAKRAEWIAWRADRVTQLVRDIHEAAKQKDARLVVSSTGGPSPFEFFACYRDAPRWLTENINEEVFQMNYTLNPVALWEMLDVQAAAAPQGCFNRINPGIEIFKWEVDEKGKRSLAPIDPAIVAEQLRVAQEHGCPGFSLYSYACLTDATIDVVRQFSN